MSHDYLITVSEKLALLEVGVSVSVHYTKKLLV